MMQCKQSLNFVEQGREKKRSLTMATAKIVIYADSNYEGTSRELSSDVTSLSDVGFNDRISSIKVFGSVWVGYKDNNFSGRQFILEEGEYPNPGSWHGSHDELSSLKRLNTDHLSEPPNIVLYGDSNYGGNHASFQYAIDNLGYYHFNDETSSIVVKTGTWILYEDYGYSGRQYIIHEGSYSDPKGWSGGHDQISSLRPVKEPAFKTEILSMTFDIASGLLNSKPVALINLSQSNATSPDQEASWSTTRSLSTTKTYEWHWENSTTIEASTTFQTGVPFVESGQISLSVANTFAVGENRGSQNTQSDAWTFNLPAKVKAKTLLTVQVIIQEGKIDVPFRAVLKRGTKRWEEGGTYKGTQSYNLHVDYNETPL
ncbi:epidermal differentiation-specific protein-like isoform X2 [Amphiura filiformis]|uniref:epidermal differentiation-specific protein-like isoform X2 n=1 Tax=Amphiura filiformis TaxID=82378 RepID=UPI003B2251FC